MLKADSAYGIWQGCEILELWECGSKSEAQIVRLKNRDSCTNYRSALVSETRLSPR